MDLPPTINIPPTKDYAMYNKFISLKYMTIDINTGGGLIYSKISKSKPEAKPLPYSEAKLVTPDKRNETFLLRNARAETIGPYKTNAVAYLKPKKGGKHKTKRRRQKSKRKIRSRRQRGGDQEEENQYLFNAINLDDPDKVEIALRNGANVNAKNDIGMTALMEASRLGYEEIVRELLNNKVDVDMKDNEGWVALIWASGARGHIGIVRELLKNGSNVNSKSYTGISALHIASINGHTEIVRELLKNDADVNAKANDGYTALISASRIGHTEIVKELLENGADVNAKANDGSTGFMWASDRGHIEIVNLLERAIKNEQIRKDTKQKAMELVTNRVGKVPSLQTMAHRNLDTHSAVLYNTSRMDGAVPPIGSKLGGKRKTRKSKKLKKSNQMRSRRKRGGNQDELTIALYDAIELEDTDKIERLLNNGHDMDLRDSYGGTPLMWATDQGRIEIVVFLVSMGVDVNARDNNDKTALMKAIEHGHIEIVSILLDNDDIDVDAADENGWTALLMASTHGETEIVKMLLAKGADMNATDYNGWTSLLVASDNGHIEIVKELLRNGADVNTKDTGGYTALISASERGYTEIVRELLKNGADVDAMDNEGHDAIEWAEQFGHETTVELLKNAIKTEQKRKDTKQEAMKLVTSKENKIPSLQTMIHRNMDTNSTVLYNNARMEGTVPPIGRKLGGKRKMRK